VPVAGAAPRLKMTDDASNKQPPRQDTSRLSVLLQAFVHDVELTADLQAKLPQPAPAPPPAAPAPAKPTLLVDRGVERALFLEQLASCGINAATASLNPQPAPAKNDLVRRRRNSRAALEAAIVAAWTAAGSWGALDHAKIASDYTKANLAEIQAGWLCKASGEKVRRTKAALKKKCGPVPVATNVTARA